MNIHIGHYKHPEVNGFDGWIEPKDESWIIFVTVGGDLLIWMDREPTGGVIGEPVKLINKNSNPHQFDGLDVPHAKTVLEGNMI